METWVSSLGTNLSFNISCAKHGFAFMLQAPPTPSGKALLRWKILSPANSNHAVAPSRESTNREGNPRAGFPRLAFTLIRTTSSAETRPQGMLRDAGRAQNLPRTARSNPQLPGLWEQSRPERNKRPVVVPSRPVQLASDPSINPSALPGLLENREVLGEAGQALWIMRYALPNKLALIVIGSAAHCWGELRSSTAPKVPSPPFLSAAL